MKRTIITVVLLCLFGCNKSNEVAEVDTELETLKERSQELEKEVAVLKSDLATKNTEYQNLLRKKNTLLNEKNELRGKLAAKDGELKTLREFMPPQQQEKETSISFKTTEGQRALIIVGDHQNLLERGRDIERETTVNNLVPVETRVYQVPERAIPVVIPGPTPRPIPTQTCR